MSNPFEELSQKLDTLIQRVGELEKRGNPAPTRIPFKTFCKEHNISRQTGYAWHERGLIQTEMIGGRRFVVSDSILVNRKYQREPANV